MLDKKLWLAIVLLFVSGALFGEMLNFLYLRSNITEQQFYAFDREASETVAGLWVEKLPNTIILAIDYALDDYSLEVGDLFLGLYSYYGSVYVVFLRINDARNKRWQFWACVRQV